MNDQRVLSHDQGCAAAPPHYPLPRDEAAAPLAASTLSDFEIVREIGRGGTAMVYEAHQTSLRRSVALKQLPSAAAFDQRWLERFRNEVRTAAQLNHAHIVPFYELGEGAHFYTMQLVDGISLAEVIRQLRQCRASDDCAPPPCQRPSPDAPHFALLKLCERCRCRLARGDREAVSKTTNVNALTSERLDLIASAHYHRVVAQLVHDAALALDYAHNQAILHLDVKPSNLLIDGSGKLWMTDFGASRATSGNGSSTADGLEKYLSATAEMADPHDPQAVVPRHRHRDAKWIPAITLVCLAALALAPLYGKPLRAVHQWNGHVYMLTSEPSDWASSEAEAVVRGGHLITINEAAEQQFVVATFLSPPDKAYWIGLTDQEKEGVWRWISGEPLVYANWQAGEPNNVKHVHPVTGKLPGEHHGVINWHLLYDPARARVGSWNDYTSIPQDGSLTKFQGILEFESDPR